jgi:hypothetical protein
MLTLMYIVFGYCFFGGATAALLSEETNDDEDEEAIVLGAILWPIVLPVSIGFMLFCSVFKKKENEDSINY